MATEASVTLNLGAGGSQIAVLIAASDSRAHQEIVLEQQLAGGGDPVKVNATNPLSVAFAVAQAIVGNVASLATDSGAPIKVGGVYNSGGVAPASGERCDLQVNATGALEVAVVAGGGTGGTSATSGQAMPQVITPVGGLSATGAKLQPVNLDASGNVMVNVAAGSLQAITDNSAFTANTTQGLAVTGAFNDSASAVTSGNMGIARITASRQWRIVVDAASNGGWTPYRIINSSTGVNTGTMKNAPGQIGFIHAFNLNATPIYLKLFNQTTNPTVGGGTPVHTFGVPGNTAGAGFTLPIPAGLSFTTGIAWTITGGLADGDTTSIPGSSYLFNAAYA